MVFYCNYFPLLFIMISVGHFLEDIVINSTVNYTWSSLLFIISVDQRIQYDFTRTACRRFSSVYCLQSFEIVNADSSPPYSTSINRDWPSNIYYYNNWINKWANEECNQTFPGIFKSHNHYLDSQGCCKAQCTKYIHWGLRTLLTRPQEYIKKLTDYDEDKQLNLISAYYYPECEVNVIIRLGFGKGSLIRESTVFGMLPQAPDMPYLFKVDKEWSEAIPYDNPGYFLTFRWFKKNVMCKEQPWICQWFFWKRI